ncbi:MAG TPA: hypothetical protein VF146_15475 [Bryobacteraceae bacterium]
MKTLAAAGLLLCALSTSSMADKPRVSADLLDQLNSGMEAKFMAIWPQTPVELVGVPQSAYINGYGTVFMSKVNLAPAAGITPFHPVIKPEEVKRTHDLKLQRLNQFRVVMRQMLCDAALSLDTVPPDEQVALGVSLFYWNWENHEGLPNEIVMHAPKKQLLAWKTAAAATGIATEEY